MKVNVCFQNRKKIDSHHTLFVKMHSNNTNMDSNNTYHETISLSIYQFDRQFAGRINSINYNPTKQYHIHRRNRALVWKKKDQERLKDTLLNGYYVPPIICNSRTIDGVTIREIMEGGNRATTFRNILEDKVGILDDTERRKIEMASIQLVVMHNLSRKGVREMFRRLNKNVKVTPGQLLNMSSDDSNLVQQAILFLDSPTYAFREQINKHFSDTQEIRENGKDPGQKLLQNTVAVIAGILHGPHYITTSFDRLEEHVESVEEIDENKLHHYLSLIFEILDEVDKTVLLTSNTHKKAQLNLGNFLGPMIYDLIVQDSSVHNIKHKWIQYLIQKRQDITNSKEATKIPGAQNITATKLKRVCTQVQMYLDEARLLTTTELNEICHIDIENDDDDDDESEEDNDDDDEDE